MQSDGSIITTESGQNVIAYNGDGTRDSSFASGAFVIANSGTITDIAVDSLPIASSSLGATVPLSPGRFLYRLNTRPAKSILRSLIGDRFASRIVRELLLPATRPSRHSRMAGSPYSARFRRRSFAWTPTAPQHRDVRHRWARSTVPKR